VSCDPVPSTSAAVLPASEMVADPGSISTPVPDLQASCDPVPSTSAASEMTADPGSISTPLPDLSLSLQVSYNTILETVADSA